MRETLTCSGCRTGDGDAGETLPGSGCRTALCGDGIILAVGMMVAGTWVSASEVATMGIGAGMPVMSKGGELGGSAERSITGMGRSRLAASLGGARGGRVGGLGFSRMIIGQASSGCEEAFVLGIWGSR